PHLNAATLRPRARIAPISATVAVVLPTPLAVAAMTTRGILPEGTIASTGNAMAPGAEFAASETRVVEPHQRRHIVWNHDLAAAIAIQIHLDEPMRGWDAAFEMLERSESRRDFRARVAGSSRPHAENPGG